MEEDPDFTLPGPRQCKSSRRLEALNHSPNVLTATHAQGHATTPHHDFKKSLNEAVARAYAVPWGTKIISAKVHWNPGQLQQKLEPLDLLELDEAEAWDQIIGIANRGAGDLLEVTFENKQSE